MLQHRWLFRNENSIDGLREWSTVWSGGRYAAHELLPTRATCMWPACYESLAPKRRAEKLLSPLPSDHAALTTTGHPFAARAGAGDDPEGWRHRGAAAWPDATARSGAELQNGNY